VIAVAEIQRVAERGEFDLRPVRSMRRIAVTGKQASGRERLHVVPRGSVTPLCNAYPPRGFGDVHSPGLMPDGVCRRCRNRLLTAGYGISWAGVVVKVAREK
jgi:hypothetical protein